MIINRIGKKMEEEEDIWNELDSTKELRILEEKEKEKGKLNETNRSKHNPV